MEKLEKIFKKRIKYSNIIDVLSLILVSVWIYLLLKIDNVKNEYLLTLIVPFIFFGFYKYKLWSCPKCNHSLNFHKHAGQFFEPIPKFCPNCQCGLHELLGYKTEKNQYL